MKRKKNTKHVRKSHKNTARKRKENPPPFKKPSTARQYFLLSPKNQETWDSIGHVVTKMREGMSLSRSAKEFGLSSKTVISLGRSALRKQKNGRYVAKKFDRLLRVVHVLSTKEKQQIATRDSLQASIVGSHWAAVQRFLQTGDDSALSKLVGKKVVDAAEKRYLLLTDLKEIERLGSAGVLTFESLYGGVR